LPLYPRCEAFEVYSSVPNLGRSTARLSDTVIGYHDSFTLTMRPVMQILARGPNCRVETEVERRKAARYGLRVPVLFSREDTQPKQAGVTRDVSASGAYVLCEESSYPTQGDTVAIQLILPPIADVETQGMTLEFTGQVLRTGDFPEESGFAVLAEAGMELSTESKSSDRNGDWP
jgi:PilZ domain